MTTVPVSPDDIVGLYKTLSKTAIALLLYLRSRDPFGNTKADLDADALAQTFECSASTIRRAIADLVDAGLIAIEGAMRRANPFADAPPSARKLSRKNARPHAKMSGHTQNCAERSPEPLPSKDQAIAQIDQIDQIRESDFAKSDPDPELTPRVAPGYVDWLLDKVKKLPKPPALTFEWVRSQIVNPVTQAEYLGKPEDLKILLGATIPGAALSDQTLPPKLLTMTEQPIRVILGGQSPSQDPEAHLARMLAKWRTQARPDQRAAIARQIAANPAWGLACTDDGPILAQGDGDAVDF